MSDPSARVVTEQELSQMTNHLLVVLSVKSPHRIEVWGNVKRSDYYKGMEQPETYFPWLPASAEEWEKNADNENFTGFTFNRY